MQHKHSWCSILLVLMNLLFSCGCNRYASLDETCSGSSYSYNGAVLYSNAGGRNRQCSPYKLLQCEQSSGTCQCPDYYNYYWDAYQQTCYIKIGSACRINFGGQNQVAYNDGCPQNSICNPGTGYCECRPLFATTNNYLGCSASDSRYLLNKTSIFIYITLTIIVITHCVN